MPASYVSTFGGFEAVKSALKQVLGSFKLVA